ncbi:MAG: 2-amino-4-hydroxy-6-hydroxymethyldihydropteridine diphosphokinase [Caldilineaceae bacterium]
MPTVLITLGSNIAKEQNLPRAIELIRHQPTLTVVAVSPIYETAPVGGPAAQPQFYNAAMRIETTLTYPMLRTLLRTLESALGRVRTTDKFAPRPIDLDIAFYGQESFTFADKCIPDPDAIRFPHLTLPLADIAPEWRDAKSGFTLRQIADDLAYTEREIRKL